MQGRLPSGGRLFLCSKLPAGAGGKHGAKRLGGGKASGGRCAAWEERRKTRERLQAVAEGGAAGGKCGRHAGRRERESRGEVKAKGAWRKTPAKGAGNARKTGEKYGRSMRGYSGRRGLFPSSPALCRAFSVFSRPRGPAAEKAPAPFRRERKTRGLSLRS